MNLYLEGIYDRWRSAGLDGPVTGGFHLGRAQEATAPPYCVLTVVSDVNELTTGTPRLRTATVQFSVFADTAQSASQLGALVAAAFDPSPVGAALHFERTGQMLLLDDSRGVDAEAVWMQMLDYEVMLSESIL
jgi:hypothetical protein